MSQIKVTGLTFGYEGSPENVFEDTTFTIDTDWKLGLIGRNGKGKTTFLRLLMDLGARPNRYEYQGSIVTDTCFDYFPYETEAADLERDTIEVLEKMQPDYELWKVCMELDLLKVDGEVLYRPFGSLSHGERTKVMLALLFSRENYFLLIDEPTNHLDAPTRELVRDYLKRKKGFILVSHDRWLLDGCIDHVLVLERSGIRVEKGNFSSWWDNKERRDQYERAENEKLKKEIGKLRAAADRTARWADKVEGRKIGFDPVKEPDRCKGTRSYIGEKSRKMQQRRKNLERRQQTALEEKEELLKNVEETASLKLTPLRHHKEVLVRAENLSLCYGEKTVLKNFNLELRQGDRVVIQGPNGCGKSSLIRAILTRIEAGQENMDKEKERVGQEKTDRGKADVQNSLQENWKEGCPRCGSGSLSTASALTISYISQDTSHLRGSLRDYCEKHGLEESLLKAVLRKIGFERSQFERAMEEYSEGQKKKVLIAGSLVQPAHLYIWDEPLNYIDVFSRMQIEELILRYQPTMLVVEHDRAFGEDCGTKTVQF